MSRIHSPLARYRIARALESRAVQALESRVLILERAGAIPRRPLLGNRDTTFPVFARLSSTRREGLSNTLEGRPADPSASILCELLEL